MIIHLETNPMKKWKEVCTYVEKPLPLHFLDLLILLSVLKYLGSREDRGINDQVEVTSTDPQRKYHQVIIFERMKVLSLDLPLGRRKTDTYSMNQPSVLEKWGQGNLYLSESEYGQTKIAALIEIQNLCSVIS